MAAELTHYLTVLVLVAKCHSCSEGGQDCIENNTDTGERTGLLVGVLLGVGGLLLVLVLAACVIMGITIWACHSWKARRAALHRERYTSCTPLHQPGQHLPSPHDYEEYLPKPNTPTDTTEEQSTSKLRRSTGDSCSRENVMLREPPRSKHNPLQGSNLYASGKETEEDIDMDDVDAEPHEIDDMVKVIHQHAKTEPQSVPCPANKTSVKLASSISNRPRLPTPVADKLNTWESSGRVTLSPTPVAQMRTTEWYDNLKIFLHPQTYHQQSKMIDDESFHYANDGL